MLHCFSYAKKICQPTIFINSAKEIKSLCEESNVPLIINDNVDVAKAVNADGVHIGQNDMPAHEARKILGKNKIIGVTAKTVEQAQKAEKDGADYLWRRCNIRYNNKR